MEFVDFGIPFCLDVLLVVRIHVVNLIYLLHKGARLVQEMCESAAFNMRSSSSVIPALGINVQQSASINREAFYLNPYKGIRKIDYVISGLVEPKNTDGIETGRRINTVLIKSKTCKVFI